MARELEKKKNNYHIISNAKVKSVVKMMDPLVKSTEKKSQIIGIDEYNKEIDKAMGDLNREEVYSHNEVIRMAKKW